MKHLEFIQAVITRMANTSFLIKAWTVTLVAAIMALAAKDADVRFIVVALAPGLAFWFLDAFYLRQERLYRKLYDEVRVLQDNQVDFSMNVGTYNRTVSFRSVFFSSTIFGFYGSVLLTVALVILMVNYL